MLRIEKLNKIYQNDRFNQIGCLSSLKTIPKNHAPRLILFFLFQDTNFLKLFRAVYESLFTKEEKKKERERNKIIVIPRPDFWARGERLAMWKDGCGRRVHFPFIQFSLVGDLRIYVEEIYAVWRERQAKETIK